MTVTKDAVLDKLRTVKGPDFEGDVVSLGLVSDIFIADGKVFFSITVPADRAQQLEPLRAAAERAVKDLPGVAGAVVALTEKGRWHGGGAASARPKPAAPARGTAGTAGPAGKRGVPGIRSIMPSRPARAVGKSTTAVNLACVTRPASASASSTRTSTAPPAPPAGLSGKPETVDGKVLKPMERYGVKAMPMGFLVEEDTPMIWRGPMVMSALTQRLREVAWGELDILVVDMPPGTGDAQLTMAQQVPLAGAVIVSTPQDLALIDARKGLNMFRRVDVPVLGIVENMSFVARHRRALRHLQ